ncbi:MAG: porin, partial [Burkholderiaceae bacterium]
MKLKQIALAAAVVAASSAALADVTVYGVADVNVNNSKAEAGSKPFAALANGFTTATTTGPAVDLKNTLTTTLPSASAQTGQGRIDSSGLSTSRIGFKGSEDLGGGMQASFQLEGTLSVDTGENANYDRPVNSTANYFFGRQSWVGLTGSFGTVQVGKNWTPFHDTKGAFEHADNTNASVTGDVWGTGSAYDSNISNQVKYTLPLSGGLTASLGYAFGEDKTAALSAKDLVSLGVTYESGPIAVGYGYQNEAQNLAGVKDSTFNVVGASYDLGAAKLVASWSQSSYNTGSLVDAAGVSTAVKTIGAATGDAKDKEY